MERKKIIEIAIEAAIAAGKDIMEVYETGDFSIDMKSDYSPLTKADLKSHERIMSFLDGTDIPVLSEEGAHETYDQRKDWQALWIVDPLDGTKEFIKRNGEFTVNIAYVVNGEAVAGVIYVPVKDVLYYGDKEAGSFKVEGADGLSTDEILAQAESLKDADGPSTYTIVASRSHMSAETQAFVDDMTQEHGQVNIVSMGSSLKICLVAEGKANVYPRYAPTMEWDTAAGHAIVKGAGKELFDYNTNQPMVYNRENLLNNWFIVK